MLEANQNAELVKLITHLFSAILLLLAAQSVIAQEVGQIPIIDAPPQTPGLGGGVRVSASPYVGQEAGYDLVPLYLYEGKFLFAHGTNFGAHLFRNDTFELNLLVRYRFAQLDPDGSDFLDGIEKRDQAWDGGISGVVRGKWGQLKLDWVTDLTNTHNGNEVDLTYRYRFDIGNWMISPYATGMWLDADLTDYYFGVSPAEARPGRPAYVPGAAFNFEWGVNTWYQLTEHVFMFANVGFRGFDSSIQNSPLVAEDTVALAFAGAGYMFGDNKKTKYAPDENNKGWSWRVNYGYQAQENVFPKLMSGQIRSSDVADTNIAGFTLGKLFQGGPRADFWGKFAVYRHLEEPLQEDFWSFTAYIMAIGKGYSPWSNKLAFRYGFGLGVSYAQKVPIVEQIKQANKGENTNRLLNYLEFMVDFPIDRLIKSKFTKNCFLGFTAAHRSGIFATSDILGSVAGGSDWVTLSYECLR
jgi:outer membrane scaffolding protein for murein synthesis (MipA/OmpV family)